ncbi:unnamed protein product [Rhodiola kirilowii]
MGKTPTVEIIRRQIQHYTPTDDDLVHYLVSNYPFYRRTKRNHLKSMVGKARMKQVETELAARNYKDEDSLEDDQELEPKVDLIKDALRDNYVKQAAKVNEACDAEKHMEVEVEVDQKSGKAAVHGGKKRKFGDCEVQKNPVPGSRFSNMGGMSQVLDKLTKQVLLQFGYPRLRSYFGVKPVTGILLHGPPGCGKTMLASAIANEARLPFYKICATEIVSGVSGDSEQNIRELFSKAARTAPSIVFIDEIDAIALKRKGAQSEMGWRIVTQLNKCMDEIRQAATTSSDSTPDQSSSSRHVLVIAATNHPDEIDPALRRPGRFDREIYIGVPDEKARIHILSVLTRGLKVCEDSLDLLKIARLTPGYVGADLDSLIDMAGNVAMLRVVEDMRNKVLNETQEDEDGDAVEWLPRESENPSITMGDFEEALKEVQPSLKREGFSSIPDVKWEDVGGLDDLRKVFTSHIVKQIMFPGKAELYGLKFDKGFLLYGPPGCGKTLLAKAVAKEAGANFIHIKGPEILNKYVGESETAVRAIFNRARTCAPCIIFFDEVDALTSKRGEEGGRVHESVALQLMMELDGGDKRSGVYVIGATNRRDAMDPAFLRPGRFGKHLYVGYPNPDQRAQILKAICRKLIPIYSNVDLDALARSAACENFSGADLSALVHEASVAASEENETLEASGCEAVVSVSTRHFKKALAVISESRRLVKISEKNSRNQIGGCAAKCYRPPKRSRLG